MIEALVTDIVLSCPMTTLPMGPTWLHALHEGDPPETLQQFRFLSLYPRLTLTPGGQDYLPLSPDQRVAVLVNSLGATPPMELLLIARRAASNLEGRGATIERVFCGSFMTSLDMAGASVSVMRVDALTLAR